MNTAKDCRLLQKLCSCPFLAHSSCELTFPGPFQENSVKSNPSPSVLLLLLFTSVVSDSVRPHRRQPTRLPRPWDSPCKNTGGGCHFLLQCMKVKRESEVAQSYPTLSNPMDCGPPGSPVHGILQARVLKWGAIAFSTLLCVKIES